MANLQSALEWARQNPQDERSRKLLEAVANGKITSDSVTAREIQQEHEQSGATKGVFDAIKKGFVNAKDAIVSSGQELAGVMETPTTTPQGQFAKTIKAGTTLMKAPINVATELGIATPLRVAGEVAQNVTGVDVNEAVAQGVQKLVQKGIDTQTAQKAMQKWAELKQNDPESALALGAVMDIGDIASNAIGLKGAGIAEKLGAKTLSKTGELATETVGKGLSKTGEAIGKTGRYVTGQTYGLQPETVSNIIKNPELFTPKEMAKIDRESIFKKVKNSVDERLSSLSETGKGYEKIRSLKKPIEVPKQGISDILEKYRINVDENGLIKTTAESLPMSEIDRKSLQGFLDTFYTGAETMSPNATLNARQMLSNMSKFESGKTNASSTMAKELRNVIDKSVKTQLPELAKLDALYAPEIKLMKNVKKIIFNADGTIKDNAISKIANLTGKGKEQVLKRIEQIVPGITENVNILKAIEDIEYAKGQKVGAYMRTAVGAGSGAIAGGPIGAVIGAVLTSPQVGVSLLRNYGKLKGISSNIINSTINKMKSGIKLVGQEYKLVDEAFQNASEKLGKRALNEIKGKGGLSIQDVSGGKPSSTMPQDPLIQEAKKYKSAEEFVKSRKYNGSSQNILDKIDDIEVYNKYEKAYNNIDEVDDAIRELNYKKNTYDESYFEDGSAEIDYVPYETYDDFIEDIEGDIADLEDVASRIKAEEISIKDEAIQDWFSKNKSWFGSKEKQIYDSVINNKETNGTAWEALLKAGDEEEAIDLLSRIEISAKRHGDTLYDTIDKKGLTDEQVSEIRREMNQGLLENDLTPEDVSQLTDIWNQAQTETPNIRKLFKRAEGLTEEGKKIESAAFEKIAKHEDKILEQYDKRYGKVINTDNFRQAFKKEGYKGYNSADVQEPSSYLKDRAFTKNLLNEGKYATLYAGGSGTGKTSAIKNLTGIKEIIDNSSVILDGNLSTLGSAEKKIVEAFNAGKKTPIIYVYRDPKESFIEGVVKRMLTNKEEGGRLVPTKVIAENHIGSWDVVKSLHNKGLDVFFVDNSLGKGKQVLSNFNTMNNKIKYPSVKELTNKLNIEAKKLYGEGKITKEQYQGYIE